MAGLKLAPGLTIDPDYYGGGTFAWLAKKGWGKTYAARVIAEELDKAGVPFVVLDPMDAFWGLRAAADGRGEGLGVPIFGGPHGDVPLEPSAGVLMADLVVEEDVSMVLSMKHFGSRSAERTFAKAFLDRLYRRNEDLVHIIMDEADLFAPQKPQAGDQPLLGTTENIVRRGRNNGIGISMLTQRPAVLNKDVLTQVDGIGIGRMLSSQDRNAVDAWVGEHGDERQGKQIKNELPELQTGECWVWIPEEDILQKVKIRESLTFDSSPTRKRKGTGRRGPKKLTDIDLGAIQQKMAATIEKADAEDPRKLNARIRVLERDLAAQPNAAAEPVEVAVPVLDEEMLNQFDYASRDGLTAAMAAAQHFEALRGYVEEARAKATTAFPTEDTRQAAASHPATRQHSAVEPPAAARPIPSDDRDLTGPQLRVLDAIAWWVEVGIEEPSKIQVGFIAGYRVGKRVGGTYGNILGQLRAAGLLDYPSTGNVRLTPEGLGAACAPSIEKTTFGLQSAVMERLSAPEQRVLAGIIDRYPAAMSKQEAAQLAGYTVGDRVGGTFGNILGRLRSLALIDYPSPGDVVALPVLFLEGR